MNNSIKQLGLLFLATLGGVVIGWALSLPFQLGWIRTGSWERDVYVGEVFNPANFIVVLVSAFLAVFWYRRALKRWLSIEPRDMRNERGLWGMLLILPILIIFITYFLLAGQNPEAVPWSVTLYTYSALFLNMLLVYWSVTAFSTPDFMVTGVPQADLLRSVRR